MRELIEKLYESEINIEFKFFWDGGFEFKIGDSTNGYIGDFKSDDLDECLVRVEEMVKSSYPHSKFAKEYSREEDLESLVDPLIKYINDELHPHCKILIDSDSAEVLESSSRFINDNHMLD